MHDQDVDREALVRLFLEESEEGLAAMEEALVTLEERPGDADALRALFRVAHTLKGNAVSLGFADVAEITHGLEDVLARLRQGTLAASGQVVDLLLASVDALREILAEAKG